LLGLCVLAVLEHAQVAGLADAARVEFAVFMFAVGRQLQPALTVIAIATKSLSVVLGVGVLAIRDLTFHFLRDFGLALPPLAHHTLSLISVTVRIVCEVLLDLLFCGQNFLFRNSWLGARSNLIAKLIRFMHRLALM